MDWAIDVYSNELIDVQRVTGSVGDAAEHHLASYRLAAARTV